MTSYNEHLEGVDAQLDEMCDLVIEWANINSHSYNLPGLDQVASSSGNFSPAFWRGGNFAGSGFATKHD